MKEHLPDFEGFDPPTEHYFVLPNEWINICAQITNMAELKVLLYIARHTWGYHEYDVAKPFTLDEFVQGRKRKDGTRMDEGTGLAKKNVIEGLQRAIADGYLLCETDESDRARIRKSYKLKMRACDPGAQEMESSPICEAATPSLAPMVPTDETESFHRDDESTLPMLPMVTPDVTKSDPRGNESRPPMLPMVTPGVTKSDPRGDESRPPMLPIITTEVTNGDSRGNESTPRSEKDTGEKHQEKNTRERHSQKNRREAQGTSAPSLSEQAQAIYQAWCSLFTVEVPLTPAIAKAAQDLAQPVARWSQELDITHAEMLKRMMHWLYETDKTGYYRRGVKLYDLAREFEAWQSATERQRRQKSGQRSVPSLQENPYSIAALIASQNPGYFAARKEDGY